MSSREFNSQGTNFCILSRLRYRGKAVGSLAGIAVSARFLVVGLSQERQD